MEGGTACSNEQACALAATVRVTRGEERDDTRRWKLRMVKYLQGCEENQLQTSIKKGLRNPLRYFRTDVIEDEAEVRVSDLGGPFPKNPMLLLLTIEGRI